MKSACRFRLFAAVAATLGAALAVSAPAAAWGPIGHRVSGKIAESNISGHARAHIMLILGQEGLAEASTWPDEERSNRASFWQETASPWHYVTLPQGLTSDALEHPPEGDAATALEQFTATLRDPAASTGDKALALRFVVHIVADLHMPLHVGKGDDRGGNWFNVLWFDDPRPTNLHWVWDEGMILRQQLSYTEYSDRLENHLTPAQVLAWWDADPAVWMQESADLRDTIYPATGAAAGEGAGDASREAPLALSWQYAYDWTPAMEQRLQQAGIRVAAYLDWVFAEVAAP